MADDRCPNCGHSWGAHQGRPIPHYHRCRYFANGHGCYCRTINPQVEAEERRAAALWNSFLGRATTKED